MYEYRYMGAEFPEPVIDAENAADVADIIRNILMSSLSKKCHLR